MKHTDLDDLDATGQAALVRDGKISSRELVDDATARIERLNPRLNAVIHEHFDRARTEASGRLADGPFRGVPFLLKDLGAGTRAGDPCNWGTRFLRDAGWRAPRTSYLVEKFLAAGFVIVGRTNVPELGAWTTTEPDAYGPTRNPWDPSRSTGGSSGGAAAAVASRMVAVAHASDGGGSIRVPASECGLVGLKPSRGRISMGPDGGELWEGFATELVVTRTVRDAAAILDAVAGPMPGDPYSIEAPRRPWREEVGAPPGRLRVGFCVEAATTPVHADGAAAVRAAARTLESLGHAVEEARPAALADPEIGPATIRIISAQQAWLIESFSAAIGREIGAADMDPDNWVITEMGRKVGVTEYLAAVAEVNRFTRAVAAWWRSGFDLLVTPTIPEPPPLLGEIVPRREEPLAGWFRAGQFVAFTIPFNVTGQPAVSLPLHWNGDGLPVGVQIVAAFGREDLLLRVAAQLEDAMPWASRRPPLSA